MGRYRFGVRKALSAVMGASVLLLGVPALTVSAAGVDDYPYRGTVNKLDPWGFYTGYCTSFAAFRLSQEGSARPGAPWQGRRGRPASSATAGPAEWPAGWRGSVGRR